MKKHTLSVACLFALLSACSKARPVKYYWGQRVSHYKNVKYSSNPVDFRNEVWDSTYNDGMMVETDDSRNKIKFIMSNVKDKGRWIGASEFEFDYTDEGRYEIMSGSYSGLFFWFKGDSLYCNGSEHMGKTSAEYTDWSSSFAGKRSY